MKAVLSRFIRFAVLGLIPTAAYNVLTIVLVETGLMGPAFAMVIGFLSAVVISYQLNRRFTWKPDTPRSRHFHMFLVISIFGAGTNYFLYVLIVQWLQLSYLFALVAVTAIIPVQNFVLNEKFNFK
jgi:putative flippase GtrA